MEPPMDQAQAEALKLALEHMISCLNLPMHLAANSSNEDLKRLIGALSAEIISKIDFEILPCLYREFPGLKSNG
jgi:hypothetical protein